MRAAAGAEEIGKRALELIRGSSFTSAGEEVVPLRVSVGGAVVRTEDKDEVETLARAEVVLGEIRAGGRRRLPLLLLTATCDGLRDLDATRRRPRRRG